MNAGPPDSSPVDSYPGDDAPRAAIAQWMARGAIGGGLPGELPPMGALVASGLRNLPLGQGEADSAGYFQMRVAIWDRGDYAGFPERPELQLRWFIDLATRVRRARIEGGRGDPLADEAGWGEWIADVLRPPEQNRGHYQQRLPQARELIGAL